MRHLRSFRGQIGDVRNEFLVTFSSGNTCIDFQRGDKVFSISCKQQIALVFKVRK